ncbi:MAG: aminotransferase class III-fold pyridoxal phosphate-dependent enzyme, partial [Pseudomonadota bacterium]
VLSGEAAARYGVFGHGYTYTGHPVMAAAALANLDIIEEEDLVARAGETGHYLNETLRRAFEGFEIAAETRGTGLVAAVEFARPGPDGWTRFEARETVAARIVRAALADGVIARALPSSDAVSFSPPFIATREEIDLAVSTIRKAAEQVLGELKSEGPLERPHPQKAD